MLHIPDGERERSPIFPISRFLQKLYEAISFKMPTIYYVFDSTFAIQPTLIKIERGKCNFTKWNTRKTTSPAKKSEINDEMFTDFRILHSRFHTACSMRDRKKMYYEVFFWPRLFVFWIRRFASEMSSSIWKDAWSSAENNVAVARGVCRLLFFHWIISLIFHIYAHIWDATINHRWTHDGQKIMQHHYFMWS